MGTMFGLPSGWNGVFSGFSQHFSEKAYSSWMREDLFLAVDSDEASSTLYKLGGFGQGGL